MIRTTMLLTMAGGFVLVLAGPGTGADDQSVRPEPAAAVVESRFVETVRPYLETYCLGCHGTDDPKGDLDLSGFTTVESVAKDLPRWEMVLEQLEAESMPPAKAKQQPTAEARDVVIAWIGAVRKLEAAKNAGDPGPVPARRLSNAEYDNTIRDLTGVDLRPTKEFPVDPANAAGFDNSAESLSMSPALVKKYLEAARSVADHLVLTEDGLAFADHLMLAATDRDKFCVRRVIDFYKRQKIDYADYFLAAWRFHHRSALGKPDVSLNDLADEQGLSRKYLTTIWTTLTEKPEDVGPIAALQAMWRELPESEEAARAGCERMRDSTAELRRRLVPEVKNLTANGIGDGDPTLRALEEPPDRLESDAIRRRRGEDPDGGSASGRGGGPGVAVPEAPEDAQRFEAGFGRFCAIFPDAFFVSERGRAYTKEDPKNTGRLLNAGFHSMTGYFRDDGPLYELMLDENGRTELDRLWREFDAVTDAPSRQYSSYLWFERAETGFMRGDVDFDFVRAEDKDAASEAKMSRLAEVYLAKAKRLKASDQAIQAIADQFQIIGETIRRVERYRRETEPRHIEALQDFAARAFRRPLSPEERQGVADFYQALRKEDGLDHEDAVRDAVVAVLMSPRFCYRLDLPGEGGAVRPLSDYDLASRLSYSLWASMPDEELLSHAAEGELHKPEVLAAQARRMLRDDRVRGMALEFAGNWLDFRRFEEHNSVDRGRFPAFDDELRRSMFEEPIRFFLGVVRNDQPVSQFLDGKHTFVNAPLARHYGIPAADARSDQWVRIDDAAQYGRGGLLPMAVFLTKNAPGLRTSPVKRGYWVVKRLLGENIPPPPPDVPDLPADEAAGERTLRETLAIHRADTACAGCHERFDSIGLAFEGYGPVGEARTLDLGGRPVDARATFPKGGEGDGLEGLRLYLETSRREEFVENLSRKLLAYMLGRTLIPSDDETIDAMRTKLDADGGRFGALVEAIVTSPQFLNKRIESARRSNRDVA